MADLFMNLKENVLFIFNKSPNHTKPFWDHSQCCSLQIILYHLSHLPVIIILGLAVEVDFLMPLKHASFTLSLDFQFLHLTLSLFYFT